MDPPISATTSSDFFDIRSARFPAGHWIAVTGADASGLQIADSSGYDMKSMSRGDFLASWSGRGIRMAGA